MTLLNIIPAIIVYSIILAIIIGAMYFVSKIGLRIKLGYWLLGGYTIVLVGAVIVYAFIPTEDIPAESELSGEELIRHQIADGGTQIESLEQYKTGEWSFDVENKNELNLFVQQEYHYFPVLIKEIPGQESINVSLYYDQPPFNLVTTIGDIDHIVQVSMENETLRVNPGLNSFYDFAHIAKEFPFTQFSDHGDMGHYIPHMYTGEFVLYIEKPEDLHLHIDADIDYEYID